MDVRNVWTLSMPWVGTLEDLDKGYGPSDTGAPGISKKGKFHYKFMFK